VNLFLFENQQFHQLKRQRLGGLILQSCLYFDPFFGDFFCFILPEIWRASVGSVDLSD